MNRNVAITATYVLAAMWFTIPLCGAERTAGPVTARQLPSLMPTPEAALRNAAGIGLTAQQRARLEATIQEFGAADNESTEQVRQESDALARLLARDETDEASVAAQFERVLAAETEVKRIRLKMSLQTRAALTPEQLRKLPSLQVRSARPRPTTPDQQELAAAMQGVKMLIQRAKEAGVDMSKTRAMWKRVNELTSEGKITEAIRLLDETAKQLNSNITTPPPKNL